MATGFSLIGARAVQVCSDAAQEDQQCCTRGQLQRANASTQVPQPPATNEKSTAAIQETADDSSTGNMKGRTTRSFLLFFSPSAMQVICLKLLLHL